MLLFTGPMWLWAAAGVAGAGAWALWRGQKRQTAVSSLKLWRDAGGAVKGTRRRVVDPLWLLVYVAAVLAAVAAAGPRWVSGEAGGGAKQVAVEWAVRSVAGSSGEQQTEAWGKVADVAGLGGQLACVVDGQEHPVKAADLEHGVALPVTGNGDRISLELRANGQVVAHANFQRPAGDGHPFGILEQLGAGETMDAALQRVFAVQQGARPGDAGAENAVVLAHDVHLLMDHLPPNAVLVVAYGDTPLPGLVPGQRLESEGEGWAFERAMGRRPSVLAWPAYVQLDGVRVNTMREPAASEDWTVLANAAGKPWLLGRVWTSAGGKPVVLVWMGSAPATESTWPKSSSFVLFFGELLNRVRAGPGTAGAVVEWTRVPDSSSPKKETLGRTVALQDIPGGAAIVLLLIAMSWFLYRGR